VSVLLIIFYYLVVNLSFSFLVNLSFSLLVDLSFLLVLLVLLFLQNLWVFLLWLLQKYSDLLLSFLGEFMLFIVMAGAWPWCCS